MGRRAGFSLIELMVVMAIMAILFAISFASLRTERTDAEVQTEAERLAAVLRQVRNRAMGERAAYGVVFNLRNAVGTSGAVLNNWDGGHFYRIIGPGFGAVGPMGSYLGFSNASKLFMVALMWVGRLEVIPGLVLLTPEYWRR